MASIHHQKFELRHKIIKLVISYIDDHPLKRTAIEYGLLCRLLAKMTLSEMKDWTEDLTSVTSS